MNNSVDQNTNSSSTYSSTNDSASLAFEQSQISHLTNVSGIDNKMDNLTINIPVKKDDLIPDNSKNANLTNLTYGPIKSSDKIQLEKQLDLTRSQPYQDKKNLSNLNNNRITNLNKDFIRTEALPHLFRNFRASKFCKRCGIGNSIVVYDSKSGSEICTRCGVVVEDRVINEEQEWRSFSNDGNDGNSKSRIGSINDAWLDDGTDSQLVVGDKKLMKTMLKHNTQASSDRLIKEVFAQLRQVASNFCLHDNIIERCKEIVKEQSNLNILRSGKKNVLAIVYVACREEGVSRTVKELLTYDRTISERELVRAINKLKKDLPRKGPNLSSSAAELMPRFCHYLQLSHEIVGIAEYVCRSAEQYINKSHRPNSLAAGAIYFVCNLCNIQIDMRSVAVAAKSGETTVRGVYRELLLVGEKLLPKDFVPKLNGGIETLKRRSKILEV